MISAPARRKSDFSPTLAAMMKSAGEQRAGQASLHGFSSQYSHRLSSALSWASVSDPSFFFMAASLVKRAIIMTSQTGCRNNTRVGHF
jgi:hypothetical protein